MRIVFEKYDGDPNELIGYQEIELHLIYDIKMAENFHCKARLVAGDYRTKPPATITCSLVVSIDSVRVCLLLAALCDIDTLRSDIQNTYLTTPNKEKL